MTDHEILLATIMVRPKAWQQVCAMGITEEVFPEATHRDLWSAIRKTELEGKRHRSASFAVRATIDGTKHLIERLSDSIRILESDEIEATARRVIGHHRLAQLRSLNNAIADSLKAFRVGDDVGKIAGAIRASSRLAENLTEANVQKSASGVDMAVEYSEFCEKRIEMTRGGSALGISSGIKRIDEAFGGGFRPHEMVIVAGRTGVGKTQFGIHATLQAVAEKKRCLFFSTEMHRTAVLDRIVSRMAGIDSRRIRSGELTEAETGRMVNAIEKISENDHITIVDDFRCRLSAVESLIELEMRGIRPPAMVVIDYAQNLKPDGNHRDQWSALKEVSSTLKQIVTRHPVALIVLAQLNRESTKAAPEVAHILGCDSFAHDCDAAILLHTTDAIRQEGAMQIRLRKMRYGEEGNLFVGVDLGRSVFRDLTPEQQARAIGAFN